MKPEEAFALLLKKCREDVHCARAVERLFEEYRLPNPNFEWKELAYASFEQHKPDTAKKGLKDSKEF